MLIFLLHTLTVDTSSSSPTLGSLYDVSFIFDLPYWKLQLLNCALLKLFRTLVGGLPAEDFQGGLNLTYDIQMANNDTR